MKTLTNESALTLMATYSPEILTVDESLRNVSISAFQLGYFLAQKEAIETALHNDIDTVPVSPSKDLAKQTLHK